MQLLSQSPVLALGAGEVLTLDDARGTRIRAQAGTVWVTEEADPKDHIVGPGDTRVVERNGRTVIQALQPAWIALAANDASERNRA
jgi:hypothetical protein